MKCKYCDYENPNEAIICECCGAVLGVKAHSSEDKKQIKKNRKEKARKEKASKENQVHEDVQEPQ